MGGGDDELALLAVGELLAQPLDVGCVGQDARDDLDQILSGVGQAGKPLPAAHEQLDAVLVLQVFDVLAHARLRGEQRIRHLGEVKVSAYGLAHDAQLLEVHEVRSACALVPTILCPLAQTSPNRIAPTKPKERAAISHCQMVAVSMPIWPQASSISTATPASRSRIATSLARRRNS